MSNEQTTINTSTTAADTGSASPITAPEAERPALVKKIGKTTSVSYTHLTLPTTSRV